MKKLYTSPIVEVEKFTVTNILTVSGQGGAGGEETLDFQNEF